MERMSITHTESEQYNDVVDIAHEPYVYRWNGEQCWEWRSGRAAQKKRAVRREREIDEERNTRFVNAL